MLWIFIGCGSRYDGKTAGGDWVLAPAREMSAIGATLSLGYGIRYNTDQAAEVKKLVQVTTVNVAYNIK